VSVPEQSAAASKPGPQRAEATLVGLQLGRVPRGPWRVAARCGFGRPAVIVSPSRLADGTPFPTYAWLTCPWLAERVGAEESAGGAAAFALRATTDPALAAALCVADQRVRQLRAAESRGTDACASVGLAGQRDPLGVKCLHAHVALVLVGVADPVGEELLGKIERTCPDDRCAPLAVRAAQIKEER